MLIRKHHVSKVIENTEMLGVVTRIFLHKSSNVVTFFLPIICSCCSTGSCQSKQREQWWSITAVQVCWKLPGTKCVSRSGSDIPTLTGEEDERGGFKETLFYLRSSFNFATEANIINSRSCSSCVPSMCVLVRHNIGKKSHCNIYKFWENSTILQ